MLRWMLEKIGGFADRIGAVRLITLTDDDTGRPYDYLRRIYLVRTRWVSVFLHQFLAPDNRLHDHPWHWISFMLAGGYLEKTLDGVVHARGPGALAFRRAGELHQVVYVEPFGGTWTLFIHGPRHRVWGELRPDGSWFPVGATYDHEKGEAQLLPTVARRAKSREVGGAAEEVGS